MKVIWKFDILMEDRISIGLPKGAEILTVQTQKGIPFLWALVDPEQTPELRYFRIYGTGRQTQDFENLKLTYISTFQIMDGTLVFHLFEEVGNEISIEN
jgi:hypothetical protein